MIDAVFLDAGETILRPHPSFPELFALICRERGVEVSPERVQEVQGRLAPHLVDLADETGVENPSLSPEGSRRFWTYLYRRFLAELEIEAPGLDAALYERFSDSASYVLFDEVLAVLRGLRDDGYRLGLISNFEGWLEEMLVELEVGDLFDCSVISGVEGVEKPDPKIYRVALERMGADASRSVHVGDSPGLDIAPARSVGMHAVLIDRLDRYPDIDCPRIKDLEELPGLVAKL